MTLNVQLNKFQEFVASDKFIKTFLFCESWEIAGHIENELEYPIIVVNCESTQQTEQTVIRTWRFIVMDRVDQNKENEQDVLSDTEFNLLMFINKIRQGDDVVVTLGDGTEVDHGNMTILGDPVIEPFKEEFADWCAGWQGTVNIETRNINNPCYE